MTAASTRRHKWWVAPGSGQNKPRRAAQSTQSQNTGSTSSSSSGGGPNDLAPSKVSGTRIQTGSDFGVMARNTGIIVDKTLICKAFVKCGRAPVCVSLRRRFGKTFNLSTIEEFLNVVNSSDAHPQSSALRIPDGEHRRAWDDVLLTAIFDNDSGIALANERKSMLGRLYVRYMRDMHQYTEN
ncbi:hypothetical protein GQ54DRAFT_335854 [Martensiomyces pterosporus]|nr:hypothetical protein GQ54DRAFT_335854 [Martensiomyces pterosporus]